MLNGHFRREHGSGARLLLAGAGCLLLASPLAAQDSRELRIPPADMRLLIEEALQGGDPNAPRLRVDAVGAAPPNLVLQAVVNTAIGDCPLRVAGRPVVRDIAAIALESLDLATSGFLCSPALALARPLLTGLLAGRRLELARRLAVVSNDASRPGPRIDGPGCLRDEQIKVVSAQPAPPDLLV